MSHIDSHRTKSIDHESPEHIVANSADDGRFSPQANQIDGDVGGAAADAQMRPRREDQLARSRKVRDRLADMVGDHDPQAQAIEEWVAGHGSTKAIEDPHAGLGFEFRIVHRSLPAA